MAAANLPGPGTSLGPCADGCAHRDCACIRAMAASTCELCGSLVGYDRPILNPQGPPALALQGDPAAWAGRLAHEECLLDKLERADSTRPPSRRG